MTESVQAGTFLLAHPTLIDPNFHRTVVLMCEHNDEGSMGIIVNRPLDASLAQLFAEIVDEGGELPTEVGRVHFGGPVESGRLLAIRCTDDSPAAEDDLTVTDGVALVTDIRGTVESIARGEASVEPFRFILGYAGWGSGQLDQELRQGSWVVRPASSTLVFGTSSDAIWSESLRELGGIHRLQAEMPPDPTVN